MALGRRFTRVLLTRTAAHRQCLANQCTDGYQESGQSNDSNGAYYRYGGAALGATAVSVAGYALFARKTYAQELTAKTEDPNVPPTRSDLPVFKMTDVEQHDGRKSNKVWTTYKNGVYDITEFHKIHPGGTEKILMAAGGSVDSYWDMYMQHKTEDVLEYLEQELRIGTLHPDDAEKKYKQSPVADDVYKNEPIRHAALIANSTKPYNAEAPPVLLTDHLFTPNALFFVRNHLPVPKTDESTHELRIDNDVASGRKAKPVTLSVAQLKKQFPTVTVHTAIQCAGNRRANMAASRTGIKGLSWNFTAISNAKFTGVRLGDVLRASGIDPSNPNVKHIHFEGADRDPTGQCYGASIPIKKAFGPETIIAFQMNGEPIPIDHGYPLRLIAPG